MSDAKLASVARWADHDVFDETERLALEFAERMTHTDRDTDDRFFAALHTRFTQPEIVELTAIVAFENFSSKFNHALRIAEQHFCPLPQARSEDASA